MRWPSGSSERDIAVRPTDLLPRRLDGHAGDLLFDGFFDVGFQRSAHPPDHQANSSGVEGPTDRRNRRASSRRAGSGASVGGSTSHQDVVAPSHSILNEPVIEAILNSRKFTPRARSESARSGRIFRIRKARFAFSAAARTDAPRTGSRGNRPSVNTATSCRGTTYTAPRGPHSWANRGSFNADGDTSF